MIFDYKIEHDIPIKAIFQLLKNLFAFQLIFCFKIGHLGDYFFIATKFLFWDMRIKTVDKRRSGKYNWRETIRNPIDAISHVWLFLLIYNTVHCLECGLCGAHFARSAELSNTQICIDDMLNTFLWYLWSVSIQRLSCSDYLYGIQQTTYKCLFQLRERPRPLLRYEQHFFNKKKFAFIKAFYSDFRNTEICMTQKAIFQEPIVGELRSSFEG